MKTRICRDCSEEKELQTEFYCTKGRYRTECKKCTIKRNSRYQKKYLAQKSSYEDRQYRKSYHLEYYQKNKEKFAGYRKKYKLKNPDYHKNYRRRIMEQRRGELYER